MTYGYFELLLLLPVFAGLVMGLRNVQYDDGVSVCAGYQHVLCASNCRKNSTYAYLTDGSRLSCAVARVQDSGIPRPSSLMQTAQPVDSFTVGCHEIYNDKLGESKRILNLTWTYKEVAIRKGEADGFFLVIDVASFVVSLNIEEGKKREEVETPQCIAFTHDCYGSEFPIIRGDEMKVAVSATPLAKKNDESKIQPRKYKVPKRCEKREPARLPTAITNVETTGNPKAIASISLFGILLPSVFACAFIIVIVAICLTAIRKRLLDNEGLKQSVIVSGISRKNPLLPHSFNWPALISKKCLMVAKSSDCGYAHILAEKLRKEFDIDITTNWENRNSTIKDGLIWYQQCFEQCEVVVLVNLAKELKNLIGKDDTNIPESNENDLFMIGAIKDYFRNWKNGEKFTILLVKDSHEINELAPKYYLKDCKAYVFKTRYSEDDGFLRCLRGGDDAMSKISVRCNSSISQRFFEQLRRSKRKTPGNSDLSNVNSTEMKPLRLAENTASVGIPTEV